MVLLDTLRLEYLEAASVGGGLPTVDLEKKHFGLTHTEVGAMVTSRWGLPSDVVTVARFHHDENDRSTTSPTIALVAVADRIANGVVTLSNPVVEDFMTGRLRAALKITITELREVVAFARETLPQIEL